MDLLALIAFIVALIVLIFGTVYITTILLYWIFEGIKAILGY